MYIKTIIIEGFKTYKEATRINFSPKHNIILGKNGSGKSNIYDAIQFVLSDKHAGLAPARRSQLLHEGSGRETIAASVEIIFDNSDHRFPSDGAEVSLKRTIGLKKDDYFLDHKNVTKSDVVGLLESAGLSKSNPYYIVQQGKVTQLVQMKDTERLNLLKDIAGTKTYDDRRKESKKIMVETDERLKHINEVIKFIDDRLKELDNEKAELEKYNTLETDRRCIEYTLFDLELKEANSKLALLDKTKLAASDKSEELHAAVAKSRKLRRDAEEELKSLAEESTKLAAQKSKLGKMRAASIAQKTKVELQYKEDQDRVGADKETRSQAMEELKQLNKQIDDAKAQLAKSAPDFDKKSAAETKAKERATAIDARLQELYAKQSRASKYKTRAERDKFLAAEIKSLDRQIADEKAQITGYEQELAHSRGRSDENDKTVIAKEAEIKKVKADIDAAAGNLKRLKEDKEKSTDERKDAWRKSNELEEKLKELEKRLKQAERDFASQVDKNTLRGLERVRQLQSEGKHPGLYGPLIELFSTEEKFYRCVETTAAGSLFHVVVDTDATASKVIEILDKEKLGRLTFIPLNRIAPKAVQYPKANDAFPMIEKLVYHDRYSKAMQQVFGQMLIARTLDIATQFSKQYDLNTITLAGDKVNRKGALTGGFIDAARSRIRAWVALRDTRAALRVASDALEIEKKAADRTDQTVARLLGEIQKVEEARKELRNLLIQCDSDLKSRTFQRASDSKSIDRHTKLMETAKADIRALEIKLASAREEIKTELTDTLTAADRAELDSMTAEQTQLSKDLRLLTRARASAEAAKNRLEHSLQSNLLKRAEELKTTIESPVAEEHSEQLEKDNSELKEAISRVDELDKQVKELEATIDKKEDRSRVLNNTLEDLKVEETKAQKAVAAEAKTASKVLIKRSEMLQKKTEATRKIQELTLPSDGFDRYVGQGAKELLQLLNKVNGQLKKFAHVNKRALEQYRESTQQKEELHRRKKELDKGRKAIDDLITHLDAKKDEAINRTFKGIAQHFSSVFSEFVPGGKAQLSLEKPAKSADADDDDDEDGKSAAKDAKDTKIDLTSQYVGIDFDADFGIGRKKGMSGWSGGQRTVLALSLIFAIQRCDPSPFYIFDEVDSALDPMFRSALAAMVTKQSETTQFISTTFRSEMLATADKFFGVTADSSTKMSKVQVLKPAEAQALIQVVEQEKVKEMAKAAEEGSQFSQSDVGAAAGGDAADMRDEKDEKDD